MTSQALRVGIVGAGANTRSRHIPGLLSQEDVAIVAVCNRRPESTAKVAEEFNIPRQLANWEDLVADPNIDSVVIGTWPNLHAPITIAALEAGKHVLCEARMARNLSEARAMVQAHEQQPSLVAQLVPSPFGFAGDRVIKRLIAEGFLGRLLHSHVYGMTAMFADPKAPLHWRQSVEISGMNALSLGILHETAMRWLSPPVEVFAQRERFHRLRTDPVSGEQIAVTTPDCVSALTRHEDGSTGVYQFSGVAHHGPGHGICLYGTDGTIKYDLAADRILGARAGDRELREIEITPGERYTWRVEAEFVGAIRGRETVQYTPFAVGVAYMAFTEAVHESGKRNLPMAVERFP